VDSPDALRSGEESALAALAAEADADRRRRRVGLAAVLMLAFVVRIGWVGLAALDPSDGEYYDMVFYHVTAHRLLAGDGYTRLDGTPTAVWPPLYPIFLAGVYALSDGSLTAGRLANPFLGILATFFTYGIARRIAGYRVGLLAALLFAACPDDVFFSNFVMSESAFSAVFTGAVWLFVRLEQQPPSLPWLGWLGFGAALGLASLTRGIALAWLAVPVVVWWAANRSLADMARKTALASLGLACVLAPWTIRNAIQMDAMIPVATSLGRTLAHAHSPYQTGGSSLRGVIYWRNIANRFEQLPQPRREVVKNQVLTRMSLRYMWNHPGHELRILPNRFLHLFRHGHVGLDIGRPKQEAGGRKPFFSASWHRLIAGVADAYFYVLLAAGMLGLVGWVRAGGALAWLVPLSLGYFTFFHVILFPDDPRYHLPMLPFLAISAASLMLGDGRGRFGRSRPEPQGPAAKASSQAEESDASTGAERRSRELTRGARRLRLHAAISARAGVSGRW